MVMIVKNCMLLTGVRRAPAWLGIIAIMFMVGTPSSAWPASHLIDGRIGVAIMRRGVVCMHIAAPGLRAHYPALLIDAGEPQSSAKAEALRPDSTCAVAGQSGYRLRVTAGAIAEGTVLAAIPAPWIARQTRDGLILVEIGGGLGTVAFHSCASADGVHITAWRERPLEGTRLWHSYVYLGMDLDQDCKPEETQ